MHQEPMENHHLHAYIFMKIPPQLRLQYWKNYA